MNRDETALNSVYSGPPADSQSGPAALRLLLLDRQNTPFLLPGARAIHLEEFEQRHQELPRDRNIVLECSCPDEITPARVALLLHREGTLSRQTIPTLENYETQR